MAIRWVLACGLALLALSGCQEGHRSDSAGGASARSIAVVNNERIRLEEFLNTHQLFFTRWDRFIRNDPEKKQEMKEIILANMIDELLLDQEARRRGVEVNQDALDGAAKNLLAPYSDEELQRMASSDTFSISRWRKRFQRRVVHERLIEREVIAKIRLTQRELRAYYERHRNQFVVPEQVKVRHIAVGSRSQFRKLVRRIKRGRDFASLVREFSITPDRLEDGDLGFVERGILPEEFDQAIFKLRNIGSISSTSKPVKTQMGYHIFRLEGRNPRTPLTFRQALPMIRKALTLQKQPRAFKIWMQSLRDKATIRIDRGLLKAEIG
ncbi:MAG: peptidylprolyl isomerase [SAR324 cluster bacterium]|nr:peptidylprolyl isomerase [SAR324 cluster bacterium]